MKYQKGFTLVELAVVITIIALLIGGVLKGQEMIQTAKLTATISQVKAYDAAAATFRKAYWGLPGDIDGSSRLPGCNANCHPKPTDFAQVYTYGALGDGKIGFVCGAVYPCTAYHNLNYWGGTGDGEGPEGGESFLFWTHLLKANLITGVTDIMVSARNTAATIGVTHPAAEAGGGFIVGYHHGIPAKNSPAATGPKPGLTLAIFPKLPSRGHFAGDGLLKDNNALTPTQAEQIDRKMDDGAPASGSVQAFGVVASCLAGSGSGIHYDANVGTRDCGLFFMIKGN